MEYKSNLGILVIGLIAGVFLNQLFDSSQADKEIAHLVDNQVESNIEVEKKSSAGIEQEQIVHVVTEDCPDIPNSHDERVLQLESELAELELKTTELTTENKQLQSQYIQELTHRASLQAQLQHHETSDVTDEQMLALLPEPYNSFLLTLNGASRDRAYQFFNKPEDLDEGYNLQVQISDYIVTHPDSNGIELDGITCKNKSCEIRILEKTPEDKSWHNIWHDMIRQPWWQFMSSHSSSKDAEPAGAGNWIFIFLDNP